MRCAFWTSSRCVVAEVNSNIQLSSCKQEIVNNVWSSRESIARRWQRTGSCYRIEDVFCCNKLWNIETQAKRSERRELVSIIAETSGNALYLKAWPSRTKSLTKWKQFMPQSLSRWRTIFFHIFFQLIHLIHLLFLAHASLNVVEIANFQNFRMWS